MARCIGHCGRKVEVRGSICPPCLARLPEDLQMQLNDTIYQPTAYTDAAKWLRQHPRRGERRG
jgi:hypothetical protein